MTLLEAIQCGVSNFPIPKQTIEMFALVRGADLSTLATTSSLQSKEYRLMEADVKMWIALGANISQGDISIDTFVSTKEVYRSQANLVYKEFGDPKLEDSTSSAAEKPTYGYQGTRL